MSDGIAIDANVMSRFGQDLKHNDRSLSGMLVERLIEKHGLVIDHNGKIQHEWFSQCPHLLFKEWFAQNMKLGRIRMVKASLAEEHKRALVLGLGFPKRGYDIAYVGAANATQKKYIVTEDIDFFDPTHKKSSHEKKEKIRQARDCGVCLYLRRKLQITIGTPLQATRELLADSTPPNV